MSLLSELIINLYEIIVGKIPTDENTLIKMHTRQLEELGDVSFPIPWKNWYHLINNTENGSETIFSYNIKESDINSALKIITEGLQNANIKIRTWKVIKTSAHLFLERPLLVAYTIQHVLTKGDIYGQWLLFSNCIKLRQPEKNINLNIEDVDLTTLRLNMIKQIIENILKLTANLDSTDLVYVTITQQMLTKQSAPIIMCGPVINEKGVKDIEHKASDFFNKRICDMRMMAQHRYQVQINSTSKWDELLSRLGKDSVTLELLANKPHKSVKITLNNLSGANKGPSFIFYNCARLSMLLKEFNSKVNKNIYPTLPAPEKIDFTLLNQPEEWELLYAYILQYPNVLKNCIRGIEESIVNPQHLITYLSNLSSVFSVYYRRVRILTDPRDHMFGRIHSRIYLLKALQIVFHNALRILNIKPVEQM